MAKEKIRAAIEILVGNAEKAHDAGDAMKFAQAVQNLAQAYASLTGSDLVSESK